MKDFFTQRLIPPCCSNPASSLLFGKGTTRFFAHKYSEKNRSNHFSFIKQTLFAISILLLTIGSPLANANTILDITGLGDTGQIIEADQAVAVAFTLTNTFTNVSVTADILCIACQGGVWLHQNSLGAGASFGDTLDAFAFASNTSTPFFSGFTLNPGLYFLILAIDSGSAVWSGSITPTIFEAPGIMDEFDFHSTNTQAFVPQSDFGIIFGEGTLHYTVEGDPMTGGGTMTPVPEPSTAEFFLLGMILVIGVFANKAKLVRSKR
ncbi:MAG: hypothetical protein OEZ57_00545 [Nitrospirota bacterium]|nr:hypothetical protein [Nitrospirota bacterium]